MFRKISKQKVRNERTERQRPAQLLGIRRPVRNVLWQDVSLVLKIFIQRRLSLRYVLLRYWNSEQACASAQEDPEMIRCWARLGNEIKILKVYEKLEEVGV